MTIDDLHQLLEYHYWARDRILDGVALAMGRTVAHRAAARGHVPRRCEPSRRVGRT